MIECCKWAAADESEAAPIVAPQQAGEQQCEECGDMVASQQALAVHAAKEHGLLRALRTRVTGRTCPVCLRMFPIRSTLLDHHHEKSVVCRINVQLYCRPLGAEEVEQANSVQRAKRPVVKLHVDPAHH